MPFAHVNDANIRFFYEDSGIPILNDKPYTTLVAVHGFGYNGHIFHRLLPIAKASHVRLITLNRRGYAGSTAFSAEETAPFDPSVTSGEHVTASTTTRSNRVTSENYPTFLQQRGAELAHFLAWFIDNEKIPPRSDEAGRASGGISLLGWSLGNVTTLSILAFSNTLDLGLVKKLEPYLRKVIIFDPSNDTLGYPTPAHWYNPRSDPEVSAEELQSKSVMWISSYFAHSPSSRDPAMLMHDFMKGTLAQHKIHPSKKPTVITPEDISAGVEIISPGHGDLFSVRESARTVHETVRIRALFNDLDQTSGPPALPKVDISYIWCTESIWQAVFAMRSLQQDIASPPDHYCLARSVRFIALEGGNHFIHYDDPLKAFATFAQALE